LLETCEYAVVDIGDFEMYIGLKIKLILTAEAIPATV
jgi:hypothetical protein